MRAILSSPVLVLCLAACSNELPAVELLAPTTGPLYSDMDVLVQARVNDQNHDFDELVVAWTTDGAGLTGPTDVDGAGLIEGLVRLPPGPQVLQVSVQDPRGDVGFAQVALDVAETNSPPTCAILTPGEGAVTRAGETTEVVILAVDADLEPERVEVTLASDVDGDLGPLRLGGDHMASVAATLASGWHRLTLTAIDELGATCTATRRHVVGVPPTVSIRSPEADAVEDIGEVFSFEATASDDLDAAPDLVLRWASDVDGPLDATIASDTGVTTFATAGLSRGPHQITLTATDSHGMSSTATVSVRVNGPPTAPAITLGPEVPRTVDDLYVDITEDSVDDDGDTLSYTTTWLVDDVVLDGENTDVIPADQTVRDQVWTVQVVASDGRLDGPVAEASVIIANSAPTISSVTLSDPSPRTDDILESLVEVTDDDADVISLTYAWDVNGTVVSATGSTLDGATWFDKGDTVTLTVTPDDGTDAGAAVAAASASTVVNSPPEIRALTIDPAFTRADSDATCLVEDAFDADGDSISYTLTWDGDGTAYPSGFSGVDGPLTDVLTDDTVPMSDQGRADTFTCTVVPSDGTDTGTTATASFDVVSTYSVGYWREFPYTSIHARNYLLGHPVTVPADTTVYELALIAKRTGGNGRIALYTDSGGVPRDLVVGSAAQGVTVGNNVFPVTPTRITAGTYWLMAVYDSTTYVGEDRGRNTVYYVSMSMYGAFPDPIGSPRSYSGYRNNYYMEVQD